MKLSRRMALAQGGAVAAAIGLGSARAQEGANYLLATASTGGTYYPVGVAIATLIKVKLEPAAKIGMSAINSAGSAENVRLLREGEAQFGILQGLFGYYAARGEGPIAEPQKNLRSICMLWRNVEQFVVAKSALQTGTVADMASLKGKVVALGRRNSGTINSNRHILAGLGIDIDEDYQLFHAGYGPSADALQDGQVAAISIAAGTPTGAITKLMAAAGDAVAPLSFTDEELAAADQGAGLWSRYVIPARTYPGQTEDWRTIAQPNFLAVDASVPEEHVYLVTRTMYENLPFLQAIHAATKAMGLEQAVEGLPLPLHPGAARFFSEAGVATPEALLSP